MSELHAIVTEISDLTRCLMAVETEVARISLRDQLSATWREALKQFSNEQIIAGLLAIQEGAK